MRLNDSNLLKNLCYINGTWHNEDNGKRIPVINPANGNLLADVPDMGKAETEAAVTSAQTALPAWSALPASERSRLLKRWFELVMQHQEDLAHILTYEQGQPLAEARGEIAYGAAYIEWCAEEAKRIYGETLPSSNSDQRLTVLRQPVGVCAAITPWNFPNAMITRKVAPALAAGCTFILRPASKTPLSALALAELADRAGVPPGVFNVITGNAAEIGSVLTGDQRIRKFSFTGSTETGKKLMAQCSATVKRVSLELGGNAPFIVFDDADLDAAVAGAVASKFRNAGQTCVCTNRFYVQADVYEAFIEKLTRAVQQLKVGNGWDEGVTIGPVIDRQSIEKIRQLLDNAVGQGADITCGGFSDGLFFQPTVISGATQTMAVAHEEIFGPLAPVFRFTDEAEAVKLANDTEYGLAAYFYSRDIGRITRVSEALEYGMVGVNTGLISNAAAPFGGIKQSGFGREGSRHGLDEYLEMKYIALAGVNS